MSHTKQQKKERIAGVLYLLAAVASLLASMCWFVAANTGQGFIWLGLAVLWSGFSSSYLRKRKSI